MSSDLASFKWAIRNIQTFTENTKKKGAPVISDLKVQGGEIMLADQPRSVERANIFFSLTRNSNSPQKDVFNELSKSIEVINCNPAMLVELENGTPEQRDFAKNAKMVIVQCNEIIYEAKQSPQTHVEMLTRTLYDWCGLMTVRDLNEIQLPQKYQIKIPSFDRPASPLGERKVTSIESGASNTSEKVSILHSHVRREPLRQTMEMYKMRAIRLLEEKIRQFKKEGLCNDIDARAILAEIPIDVKCTDEDCEITQQLALLDGHSYRIKCVFSRANPAAVDYHKLTSSTIELIDLSA